MNFKRTEVFNFEGALRGMRNPLESWDKSDSKLCKDCTISQADGCYKRNKFYSCVGGDGYVIGEKDLGLAQRLIKGGSEHRKFLRQIMVSVDITAPLYWWKEFDTYKIGTTANSTSTMHKIASKPITLECFEIDDYGNNDICYEFEYQATIEKNVESLIVFLEELRVKFLETKDIRYWRELIRWLPESWLQTRTVTLNYENIYHIYNQRRNHKLIEWSYSFVDWVETLPNFKELFLTK